MINRADARLTDAAYVELVRGILSTLFLTLIAGSAFAVVGAAAVVDTGDTVLMILWAAGVAATLLRVAVLVHYRRHRTEKLTARRAGRIERLFAWSYLMYAAVFGAFMATAFALGSADLRLLIVGMVFGHGAGVAAGAVLRPWIGTPALLLGVLPLTLTAFLIENQGLWGVGALSLLYTGGGTAAMLRRYAAAARQISLERLVATVSQRDEPTGLANYTALVTRFDEISSVHRGGKWLAMHVVQIDGFDHINAHHGYPMGDMLLKEVAQRLERLQPPEGLAVRLGGVSFALVQAGLDHPGEAEALANKAYKLLSEPFSASVENVMLAINVGYSFVAQGGARFKTVLDDACRACERARVAGSGVAHSFSVRQ
jgi:diguanylate cyclase (GGDEF)-like protein